VIFHTAVQMLTRFQQTQHVTLSLCGSGASCSNQHYSNFILRLVIILSLS